MAEETIYWTFNDAGSYITQRDDPRQSRYITQRDDPRDDPRQSRYSTQRVILERFGAPSRSKRAGTCPNRTGTLHVPIMIGP